MTHLSLQSLVHNSSEKSYHFNRPMDTAAFEKTKVTYRAIVRVCQNTVVTAPLNLITGCFDVETLTHVGMNAKKVAMLATVANC